MRNLQGLIPRPSRRILYCWHYQVKTTPLVVNHNHLGRRQCDGNEGSYPFNLIIGGGGRVTILAVKQDHTVTGEKSTSPGGLVKGFVEDWQSTCVSEYL